MRIAFVSIPRFPCAVEAQRDPRFVGASLIIGDADQPKQVFDCSPAAAASGVRHGMTIRAALGRCPDAAVLPPDPVLYRNRWEVIVAALGQISPEVEDTGWGSAYLNAGGLQSHYPDEAAVGHAIIEAVEVAANLEAAVGLADGKFLARAAASTVAPREVRVIPPRDGAGFLAPLAVSLLPLEPPIIERMRLLGLEQIGDLAPLTVPELQSQFGFEGRRIWELAHGIDAEPLRPRRHANPLQTTISLESSVAGVDVMIAIAGQLLSRLKPSLNGRAARELTLQAELSTGRGWEHHLVFREPVSENERLTFLLRSALNNFPPPQAIRSLSLRLGGLTGETGKQLALGQKPRQQRQLEEAIRQLKARYGYSPIYRCVDVEAWSVIPEDRQILVESDV